MERKTILENIRKIRSNKGFSQDYFASRLGMKQAGYALIEKGERGLQYELLLQIAVIFEMDVIDIITYPQVYELPKNEEKNTTKVVVEFEVTKDEFLQMGLAEKLIRVIDKNKD